MIILKNTINKLHETKQMLLQYKVHDEYIVGMYNGFEMFLSILENRTPDFMKVLGENKAEEKKETSCSRTNISGCRKVAK